MNFQAKAIGLVIAYFNAYLVDKTDSFRLSYDDVYVVWFCKTLQNWKCLISTTVPDGMYYEVTYNGDLKETYIDAYKKFNNMVVPDDPEPIQDPLPGVNAYASLSVLPEPDVSWVTTDKLPSGTVGFPWSNPK